MKYLFYLLALFLLSSCKSYKPISGNSIKNVYVVFKSDTWAHRSGYRLADTIIANWDKKNNGVKAALARLKDRRTSFKKQAPGYLDSLLITKKTHKYVPIKVLPLMEFGYIETTSNDLICYGIMDGIFIDLDYDRVYSKH